MPEKSLNTIPRNWRDLYEKGKIALQRNNLEYALTIFNQVLQSEPGFYECREALRAAQFKKAGAGAGFFKKAFGAATSQPLLVKAQMALRKNPIEAVQIAEQLLNGDPHSTTAHKLMAEAALAAEMPRTASLSLEILLKNSPKDKELAVQLGRALAQAGQVPRAEAVFSELLRVYPNDPTFNQELKNLSARKTLDEGGYDALAGGKGSYRDILRDKEEAVSLEQEKRDVKTEDVNAKLIRENEARLVNEPKNLKVYRSLAEQYTQKKDFDRALDYYNRIIEMEGGSEPSIERAIAELTLKKFDLALSQLDPGAADYAEKTGQLTQQRQEYQLTEAQRRADKYPTDLQIRFDLGQLYFEAGKISEAIQEFQKAQNNPHRRIQALNCLGQCFARRGMLDLAARTLQNAIKEKQVFDEEKKELIYSLGCVLEKMNKADEAIEQFKQIYEVDIGYKDVAAKVDAYYASKQ